MSHVPSHFPETSARISTDPQLWEDFLSLCDCGGRLAGTPGEQQAFDLIRTRVSAATGVQARSIAVPYRGWSVDAASISLHGGGSLPCHPLLRSVPTPAGGLTAEVIDLGRGTPEE